MNGHYIQSHVLQTETAKVKQLGSQPSESVYLWPETRMFPQRKRMCLWLFPAKQIREDFTEKKDFAQGLKDK